MMKNKNLIIRYCSVAILAAGIVSCGKIKDFGNTNDNPGGITNPPMQALLTNVLSGVAGFAAQTRGGLYAQYYSETQYTEVSLYNTPQLDFDGTYAGSLMDLQNIITNSPNQSEKAVSRILKAYIYWNITDRWGDIPYSEALNLSVPKYDKQEAIYKDLIKELTEAVAQFDGSLVKGDIAYSGDQAKWKKLANSLRMQMALRLSKQYPGATDYAATQFAAAAANPAGHIVTNADNFVIAYPGGAFQNIWFGTFDGRKDAAESKTFTDLLTGLSDSRITVTGDNATGFPYGLPRSQATTVPEPWPLILASSKRAPNSPIVVVSAAVTLFAKAEAIERGWIPGATTADAEAAYGAGIAQSFAQWGLTMPAGYLTSGSANYATGTGVGAIGQNAFNSIPATSNATTTTKIQRIQLQRYIATYPDGTQAWSEWRRTGVPGIMPTAAATNSTKQIPRRFTYGQNEYNLNAAGVAQAIASQGADTQDTKVWWDK